MELKLNKKMSDLSIIDEFIKKNIENIVRFLDEEARIIFLDKSKDEQSHVFWVRVDSKEPAFLIGQRGNNLKALQHLISIISQKQTPNKEEFARIIIDVNNYRLNRLDFLKKIALINYHRAIETNHAVILRPMSAYERRVIHLILASKKDIKTESLGEDPSRRVVIRPIKNTIK